MIPSELNIIGEKIMTSLRNEPVLPNFLPGGKEIVRQLDDLWTNSVIIDLGRPKGLKTEQAKEGSQLALIEKEQIYSVMETIRKIPKTNNQVLFFKGYIGDFWLGQRGNTKSVIKLISDDREKFIDAKWVCYFKNKYPGACFYLDEELFSVTDSFKRVVGGGSLLREAIEERIVNHEIEYLVSADAVLSRHRFGQKGGSKKRKQKEPKGYIDPKLIKAVDFAIEESRKEDRTEEYVKFESNDKKWSYKIINEENALSFFKKRLKPTRGLILHYNSRRIEGIIH